MSIAEFLKTATESLAHSGASIPRLDAQLMIGHVLKVDKAWILAHPEHIFDSTTKKQLNKLLNDRLASSPMAYLLGKQEFYGYNFIVTPHVLIPRPETEAIIEELINLDPKAGQTLCDVGTGSGAIAISCKLQLPNLSVEACDISNAALQVASKNAQKLGADVRFFKSDLLKNVSKKYDFIAANLPYVDRNWPVSPETKHEPQIALFASDNGLQLIKKLVDQIKNSLKNGGYILLEADPRQHDLIKKYASSHLRFVKANGFCIVFRNIV